jgi:hypothetical protein
MPPTLEEDRLTHAPVELLEVVQRLATDARPAALLSAKRTERLQITQVSLPQSYLDLGKAIHAARQYRNTFPELYAKIDEVFQRIRELKQARPADDLAGSSGRAKAVAATSRNSAAAKVLFAKLADQFRLLGKAAFEKAGQSSGPSQLTTAIAEHHRQLATLDAEIAALEPSAASRPVKSRRILVGAVGGCGLVLLFCWVSRKEYVVSDKTAFVRRTDVGKPLPDSAELAYQEHELRELAAAARNGVAESRMLKLRRQRNAANYAARVKEVDDFKNGTIGCPREWIDVFRMWKGRYMCLEGVPVHVIQVTGPDEFVAEGLSPETSGKRVIMRGWNTTGFADDERRSLSGVSYSGGKTATYGSVLSASGSGDVIEKVPDELVRYVLDSLLKPAPK